MAKKKTIEELKAEIEELKAELEKRRNQSALAIGQYIVKSFEVEDLKDFTARYKITKLGSSN